MCQTIQIHLEFVFNIEYIFGLIKRKKEKCCLISDIMFKTLHMSASVQWDKQNKMIKTLGSKLYH